MDSTGRAIDIAKNSCAIASILVGPRGRLEAVAKERGLNLVQVLAVAYGVPGCRRRGGWP